MEDINFEDFDLETFDLEEFKESLEGLSDNDKFERIDDLLDVLDAEIEEREDDNDDIIDELETLQYELSELAIEIEQSFLDKTIADLKIFVSQQGLEDNVDIGQAREVTTDEGSIIIKFKEKAIEMGTALLGSSFDIYIAPQLFISNNQRRKAWADEIANMIPLKAEPFYEQSHNIIYHSYPDDLLENLKHIILSLTK